MGSLEDFRALMYEIFELQPEMNEDRIYLQGERTPSEYPKTMGRWEVTLGGTLHQRGFILARQLANETTKLQFAYYNKFQPIGLQFETNFINHIVSQCMLLPASLVESNKRIQVNSRNKSVIRDNLATLFSLSELRSLCFDLEIQYDNLHGDTIMEKSIELVDYCYRHGLKTTLVIECQKLRPHVFWPTAEDVNASSTSSLRTNVIALNKNEQEINLSNKTTIELSEGDTYFLYWAMKFIEGGLISQEDERQRSWMEFEFKRLLADRFSFDYDDL